MSDLVKVIKAEGKLTHADQKHLSSMMAGHLALRTNGLLMTMIELDKDDNPHKIVSYWRLNEKFPQPLKKGQQIVHLSQDLVSKLSELEFTSLAEVSDTPVEIVRAMSDSSKLRGNENDDTQASMLSAHMGIRDLGVLFSQIELDKDERAQRVTCFWKLHDQYPEQKVRGQRFVLFPSVLYQVLEAPQVSTKELA
ncbi:hypothetical protein [Vibrio owensii]|uniref:hypothetical protein n=1 Tax=Vibrio owensii TaxID=696485 RepID=UPI004068BB38